MDKSLPPDRIYIRNIRCRCIVGINPEEREKQQDIILNITLWTDLAKPGHTDNIADTVDYKELKKRVLELAETSAFFLIERLAQEVASLCLEDCRVSQAQVSVDKPGALRFADSVAVEITRGR
jgi:dihydroneopterin aldolase/D-erythro-7,8-dihydroneopterin triphosphate epimerase